MTRPRDLSDGATAQIVTIASVWAAIVEPERLEDVLTWPPDVFALVDRALDASEAYRFVVSPPPGRELTPIADTARAVATQWWEWLDGTRAGPPEAVVGWWKLVREASTVTIDALSVGAEWHVTDALLALHSAADEACAGLGVATAARPGPGCTFRAAARELLAERRSLSRISPGVLRVLPRCRVSAGGISIHSLSQHVFVSGPQVDLEWHRMLSAPTGVSYPESHANGLLLPWPLRVRARDFHSVPYTLPHLDATRFGFFAFEPDERLDLELVSAVLDAAIDEAGTVDFVFLPEAAVQSADIEPLEELLGSYGVWCLIAGVREPPSAEHLGRNWVHIGIRQELVWRHAVQHKHHRWRLDGRQIEQYHLGGALMPTMQWWEAVSIPRRSLQVIDQGGVTIVPLVCEDLARPEPVAELVRSVGPSLVVTVLLDGPQLSSRWTARYASILADDPGSAVCTLTSFGMAHRCRPPGCAPSRVVALWKDAYGELTEIELDEGADAVLIATNLVVGGTVTADGRSSPGTTSTLTLASVQSLRAGSAPPASRAAPGSTAGDSTARTGLPRLDEAEVSKATSWAEAVAEAAVAGPAYVDLLLAEASSPAWRARLGLRPPSRLFEDALELLRRELPRPATVDGLLAAAGRLRGSAEPAAVLTGTLIELAVGQRLFAGVQAGRLPADVLRSLSAPAMAGRPTGGEITPCG
jgi:hypothetical protein